MIAPHLETEFKLRATAELRADAIDALLAASGIRCRAVDASTHTDTYLDDDRQTLMLHGIGLRLRQGRSGAILGHKTAGEWQGALRVREEIELPWSRSDPPRRAADLPAELRDRIEPYVLDRPLHPQLVLHVLRAHREIARDGVDLGELVVDAVTAEAGARRAAFTEVELEVRGDCAACEELVERLRTGLPLEPASDDKLAHAAALLDRVPPPPTTLPADSLGHLLTTRWQLHLGALRTAEVGVRSGTDPEEVHRLRVCLRRLRVLVRAFRSAWTPDDAEFLQQCLTRISRSLGGLRDRDVMIAEFPELLVTMPEPLQTAGPELLAHLRRERGIAHEAALAMLRDGSHRADLARLEQLGSPAAMVPMLALQPARDAVRDCVRGAARRLRRLVEELGPDAPTPDVHKARIAVKRLRYLVEELAPPRDRRDRKARSRLERAQIRLGSFCDHETAARQYLDLLAASDPSRSRTFHALLGGLASLHGEAARAARTRAISAARQLGRRKFQARLEGTDPP